MYTLTLTASERAAIDWVGYRYAHGSELAGLLMDCLDDTDTWEDEGDITFRLPEYIAWEVGRIGEACEPTYSFECFSPALTHKLTDFCRSIV